jgi:signal transduction histidine kinase
MTTHRILLIENNPEIAIVKAVVEKHRGKVVVESMGPDRGSTFKVILPALPDEI